MFLKFNNIEKNNIAFEVEKYENEAISLIENKIGKDISDYLNGIIAKEVLLEDKKCLLESMPLISRNKIRGYDSCLRKLHDTIEDISDIR